jgi:flagellum-specific peptidoglycan hydrolase FlgJ
MLTSGSKGKSPTGHSTTFATHEVTLSGQRISEVDAFRAYSSYAEAADDYASLIQRKYPAAFAFCKIRKNLSKPLRATVTLPIRAMQRN